MIFIYYFTGYKRRGEDFRWLESDSTATSSAVGDNSDEEEVKTHSTVTSSDSHSSGNIIISVSLVSSF